MPRAVIRIRREPAYRRDAFESGLRRLGYEVLDGSRANAEWIPTCRDDLLVTWNRKHGIEERMADAWEAKGGTVIVAENGYLAKTEKTHYAISVHGHCGSGWFPLGTEDRFTPLGFDLKPMNYDRLGYVLVIGQRGVGSRRMASPARWGEALAKISGHRFRPHPGVLRPRTPLEADLASAREVRIWSSSVGVRALVEGIPVHHSAPHWICEGEHREAALHRMSWGQWTVAEIAAGEPFARMKAENWGPKAWR